MKQEVLVRVQRGWNPWWERKMNGTAGTERQYSSSSKN